MTACIAKPKAANDAQTRQMLHVAVGLCPMVAVAAGSVDLRKAHCVTGKQACGNVMTVNI